MFTTSMYGNPQRTGRIQAIGLLSGLDDKAFEAPGTSPTNWVFTYIRSARCIFWTVLITLVPSFITKSFSSDKVARKIHPTSFLDGLRGCAAFVVAYVHLVAAHERWLLPSYGLDGDKIGSSFLQLPLIRVLFAARPMVHIFMVVSGYVLSCKAIRLIRLGKYNEADEVVVSMIFRRGIRLFLPSIVGIFLTDVSAWYGWQHWQVESTVWGKLRNICINASHLVWSWDWDHENSKQLLQLWTIPVEFACSMLLFVVLLGTSRLKCAVRLCVVGTLAVHCHACGRWGPFEFLAGMVMAETEAILAEPRRTEQQVIATCPAENSQSCGVDLPEDNNVKSRSRRHFQTTSWAIALFVGLFLAGYPEEDAEISLGFSIITRLTPKVYIDAGGPLPSFFWFSIAAILIISALFRVSSFRRLFETPIAQYLGDVSYSVYIVHYPTVLSLAPTIVHLAHLIVGGTDSQLKRLLAVVLEVVILMVIVIWQADLFWRLVDKPVVAFARRAEMFCRH